MTKKRMKYEYPTWVERLPRFEVMPTTWHDYTLLTCVIIEAGIKYGADKDTNLPKNFKILIEHEKE